MLPWDSDRRCWANSSESNEWHQRTDLMVFSNGKDFCIRGTYIFRQSIYPEPAMAQNRYSSPTIPSDDDTESIDYPEPVLGSDQGSQVNSSTESESPWWLPENQAGLQSGERLWEDEDNEEVALDQEGEIKYHEQITKH